SFEVADVRHHRAAELIRLDTQRGEIELPIVDEGLEEPDEAAEEEMRQPLHDSFGAFDAGVLVMPHTLRTRRDLTRDVGEALLIDIGDLRPGEIAAAFGRDLHEDVDRRA